MENDHNLLRLHGASSNAAELMAVFSSLIAEGVEVPEQVATALETSKRELCELRRALQVTIECANSDTRR